MKEMLFITVAVLVPPMLTYLGVVGDSTVPRAELTWQSSAPTTATRQPADTKSLEASALRPCWPENNMQAHQQQTY